MKRIHFLLFVSLFCFSSFSKAQIIPNPGFETWEGSAPLGWTTTAKIKLSAGIISYPITLEFGAKSTDNYSGNFALQVQPKELTIPVVGSNMSIPGICQLGANMEAIVPLQSIMDIINGELNLENPGELLGLLDELSGLVSKGIPFNRVPETIGAYVKFLPAEGSSDSLSIIAISTKWDSQNNSREYVAFGSYVIGDPIESYRQIVFPMEEEGEGMSADSLSLIFICGGSEPNPATLLLIDQVGIDQELSIKQYAHDLSRVYPNPSVGNVLVEPKDENTEYAVRLYDMNGKKVLEETALVGLEAIATSSLKPGIYLLEVVQGEFTKVEKLVIR